MTAKTESPKYSFLSLSEAKKHFKEARPGNCICWRLNNNMDTPFGIGCDHEDAENNGINKNPYDENRDLYDGAHTYFTIVIPDGAEDGSTELIDFSFIFKDTDNRQDPYSYIYKHENLVIAFLEQPCKWIGAFGNPNLIENKIQNEEDNGNYFIVGRKLEKSEDFELKIIEPPSIYFIEAIRQTMGLNIKKAAERLDITENEWHSFIRGKTSMNKWQWSIFLYFFTKECRVHFSIRQIPNRLSPD